MRSIVSSKLSPHLVQSVFLRITFAVLSLALTTFLARELDKTDFGLYTFYISIYAIVLLPFTTGFARYNVRFIASLDLRFRLANATKLIQHQSRHLLFATALILVLLAVVLSSEIANFPLPLAIIIASLPFVVQTNLLSSAFRGLGNIFTGNSEGLLVKPLLMLIGVFCVSRFTDPKLSLLGVTVVFFVTSLVTFLIYYSIRPKAAEPSTPNENLKPYGTPVFLFTLIGSIEVMNANLDTLLLGVFSIPEQVAAYKLAISLRSVALLPTQAFLLFIPFLFASVFSQGEILKLQKSVKMIARLNFLAVIIICGAFYGFGTEIIDLLFGPTYNNVAELAFILLFGIVTSSLFGQGMEILIAAGEEKWVFASASVLIVATIALNSIFIPTYGAVATAWIYFAAAIIYSSFNAFCAKELVGINPTIF
jgi:O-antigen/teichoic acid export membrane protein